MIIKCDKKRPAGKRFKDRPLDFPEISLAILILSITGFFVYQINILGDGQKATFSHSSGHYKSSTEVRLKSSVLGSEIFYTIDGSEPNQGSLLYEKKPIKIEETLVLKAKIFKNGEAKGETSYSTYFIDENSDLPVVSLVADSTALWSEEEGIYNDKNEQNKGEEWIKNGNIQFFEPNQKGPAFEKEINFRVYGGKTRRSDQKSLKVCTGDRDSIEYEIFKDYDVKEFKCLLLRNSGGDWVNTMFKDAMMQEIIRENSDITTQNSRPAVLYINGQYFGIHNIREHYNDNYFANKYKGRRTDYAILFPDRDDKGRVQIESGDKKDAEDFYELRSIVKKDLTNPEIMAQIEDLMDVSNFLEYNIYETFYGNDDWIENNIKIWRYNGVDKEENEIYGNDGKFRWMVYDLDGGFGNSKKVTFDKNVLKLAVVKRDYSGREWPYVILRRLLENESTRNDFLNKYADMLNTTFLSKHLIAKVDKFESIYEKEMVRHIERWKNFKDGWGNSYLQDLSQWKYNVEFLREFARQRPEIMYKQLTDQFTLEGVYNLNLSLNDVEKGYITVNSISINDPAWSGKYFINVPVAIESVAKPGHRFVRWEGDLSETNSILKFYGTKDTTLKAVFE